MADDLKNCPFCGKKVLHRIVDGWDFTAATCITENCPLVGIDVAVDAWENRPLEAALRAEVSSLRSSCSSLQSEVERMKEAGTYSEYSSKPCPLCEYENGDLVNVCGYHAEIIGLQNRERRYVEALEKIGKDAEQYGAPLATLRSIREDVKEALSPAPGSQEPVYGPTGVCPEHGVMKERCKCPQEAEAKGCVCSGGIVVHRTDGPCYHAESGDYIPKEMMK